jgi:hypothetical protein
VRGQRREARRQAAAREARVGPEGRRPQPFVHLVRRLGHPPQTRGKVRLRARSQPGAGVVPSRARAGRGGLLKHARLVACDGARVPCPSRARQAEADGATAGAQRLTVSLAALLPRWRRPVPRPQTRGGRASGRYHRSPAAALAVCRAARGQPPLEAPAVRDGQTGWAPRGAAQPARWPPCGPRLVGTGVIPRGGAPPPLRAGERAA